LVKNLQLFTQSYLDFPYNQINKNLKCKTLTSYFLPPSPNMGFYKSSSSPLRSRFGGARQVIQGRYKKNSAKSKTVIERKYYCNNQII
jgi:hypothetical protein